MPPAADAPEWSADIVIDERLVRELLSVQFPDLDVVRVRLLAEGWDNAVWLVNSAIAFRFPRRTIAVAGLEREIQVLPRLANRLNVTIPSPERVGRPSAPYPWPFFGGPLIEGNEPAQLTTGTARDSLGSALGAFLHALHAPETMTAAGNRLPFDPNARGDTSLRRSLTRQRLELLSERLWTPPSAAETILERAERTQAPPRPALVHGDLHVRHVLLRDDGSLSGVIDWGDVCIADPAIDLSLYWSLLDPDGRRAFREAYAAPDIDQQLLKARMLALFFNAALALYADDVGNAALLRETIKGLERTLVDE